MKFHYHLLINPAFEGANMKFHYHLLINPAAGSGNAKTAGQHVVQLLEKGNYPYTAYVTEKPGEEAEIAENLAEKTLVPWTEETPAQYEEKTFPLLVVLGGDGTLHQVLNRFCRMKADFPVAYLPAGSGNDLARAIRMPRETEKAFWHLIKTQAPRAINIIAYNEKICELSGIVFNNFGIGLDAFIVATTNESAAKKTLNKYKMGSLSYISSILKVLFTQKGFPVLIEANGQEINFKNAFLCTTTNHPYFGGGVAIAPMASVEKPELDLVIVERIALFKIFWLILLLVSKRHTKSKYFHQINAKRLRLVSTIPQFAQTDGEVIQRQPYDVTFSTAKLMLWY